MASTFQANKIRIKHPTFIGLTLKCDAAKLGVKSWAASIKQRLFHAVSHLVAIGRRNRTIGLFKG